MPFELAEERGSGRVPLYCYRPLSTSSSARGWRRWATLPSHADAAHALARCEALDVYLSEHGVKVPPDPRGTRQRRPRGCSWSRVFTERSGFGFEPAAFEAAYAELERAIYEGHCTATVIAPLLGVALDPDTIELSLGDGLSLIRGDALAEAPPEAVWGEGEEPNVLALLAIDERAVRPPAGGGRPGALPPRPERAATVRARRLRGGARRLGADRGRELALGLDRRRRSPAAADDRPGRPGGGAARVLPARGPARPPPGARLGAGPV